MPRVFAIASLLRKIGPGRCSEKEIKVSERVQPEDPKPDRDPKRGDMGRGSLEESMRNQKGESGSSQGPRKVPIPSREEKAHS
jgi:hypothetical protein